MQLLGHPINQTVNQQARTRLHDWVAEGTEPAEAHCAKGTETPAELVQVTTRDCVPGPHGWLHALQAVTEYSKDAPVLTARRDIR